MHHRMRGVALFAYDAKLVSRNPDAPVIGKTLRRAAEKGADSASTHVTEGEARIQRVLVRMSWSEGPCAFVLVERVLPPRPGLFAGLAPWPPLVVPVLVVLFAILVAIGPVVRRIRRLTGAVQAAARDGYKEGVVVEGSDEIAELARAFDGAGREIRARMDEVASREEALRALLENTTHDVMIPLTVLQGHLTALRDAAEAGERVPAEKVRAAIDEAHYMASLVHNLGVAAKLEGGAPTLRHDPIDLVALVERAVARHRPLARGEDVQLESGVPPEPVVALGDVTLAEQAVGNLVYNAVRYNHAGGHVAVTLSERDGRFTIEIVDDGPGIPAADLERLRARKARGDDARERAPGGRGLGLDIAESVAEAHGWTLTLEPSPHGGLSARIEGPVIGEATKDA